MSLELVSRTLSPCDAPLLLLQSMGLFTASQMGLLRSLHTRTSTSLHMRAVTQVQHSAAPAASYRFMGQGLFLSSWHDGGEIVDLTSVYLHSLVF